MKATVLILLLLLILNTQQVVGIEYSIKTKEFPAAMQYRNDLELNIDDEITWDIKSWKLYNQSEAFYFNSNYTYEDFYLSLRIIKKPNGEKINAIRDYLPEYFQLRFINLNNSKIYYNESLRSVPKFYLIPSILEIDNKTENIFKYWINNIHQTTSEIPSPFGKINTQISSVSIKDSIFFEDKYIDRINQVQDISIRYHTETGILLYYSSNTTGLEPPYLTIETIFQLRDSPLELPTNFYFIKDENLEMPNLLIIFIVLIGIIVIFLRIRYKLKS